MNIHNDQLELLAGVKAVFFDPPESLHSLDEMLLLLEGNQRGDQH